MSPRLLLLAALLLGCVNCADRPDPPSDDDEATLAPLAAAMRARAAVVRRADYCDDPAHAFGARMTTRPECIYVEPNVTGGVRGLIYRRVPKCGSMTMLEMIKRLWRHFDAAGPDSRPLNYFPREPCDGERMERARAAGSVDFTIVRDPLERCVGDVAGRLAGSAVIFVHGGGGRRCWASVGGAQLLVRRLRAAVAPLRSPGPSMS